MLSVVVPRATHDDDDAKISAVHAVHGGGGGGTPTKPARPRTRAVGGGQNVANWTEPPTGIEGGRLSNAPLLGNGDLGISVGGSLRAGKPRPMPPSGGQFAVGAAPCNASDSWQLWTWKVLTSHGTMTQGCVKYNIMYFSFILEYF